MLTKEQMEANKMRFLQLISNINIEGADTAGLVDFLDNSDFFTAPASTVYHSHFDGGLCLHSLNVYDNLVKLNEMYGNMYDANTILVCGLLHDLAKVNFYESFSLNKKVYSERGLKHDNKGKFDWIAQDAYKTKDAKDRLVGATHGFNSMYLIQLYIPMTYEEALAIYWHHMGMDDKNASFDLSAAAERYKLIPLLHSADLLATYIQENSED